MLEIFLLIMLLVVAKLFPKKAPKNKNKKDWDNWYYNYYLKSRHWRKRRARALYLANYRCNRCKSKQNLQVHHLSYRNLGHELDSDLEVLCRSCHARHHHKAA